ncbi:inosine/xanthosine triphosphatase [Halobium salinum]|uniref:inosine/xanthosine triphosphatase n=1 Tax=Halobium salinum TaxID=1364940 RepID=A0ABD5PH45_9EURY|nr:inosine/xanthosine triphosphatase [Halobium salinum]
MTTRVGVGSGNPVKRRAVEAVLNDGNGGFAEASVEAVPVDSGVSEQPEGHAETLEGAENRARAVVEAGSDLGVGVEGGVATLDAGAGDARGDLYLVMWAAVTDGDRWGRGSGPALALPADVAERVRDGEELGPVMDDTLGEEHVARKQGAVGAFTGGRVDRADALATAVAGALGPFVTDHYRTR